MKKFTAFALTLLLAFSLLPFAASAAILNLAEIYSEYAWGESILIQGTTDRESILVLMYDSYGNSVYVRTIKPTILYEGLEIPITESWDVGDYTLKVGYSDVVVNEYHITILEQASDKSDSSDSTSGKALTATQITLSPSRIELKVGESASVVVTSENSSLRWETDDEDLITISGTKTATVTAKKVGSAIAWVYSGNNYATLEIKITPADRTTTSTGSGSATSAGSKTDASTDEQDEQNETQSGSDEEQSEEFFTDISSVPWAIESINALARDEIINGMSEGIFAPEENVTRAQFVKMIVEAFGFEGKGTASFTDVSESDWYGEYVLIAANNSIVNGYGATFGPNDNITCQDAALILSRVAQMQGISLNETDIEETQAAEYAREAVALLKGNGIIADEMEFSPEEKATRAQSAYLIYGIYKLKQAV